MWKKAILGVAKRSWKGDRRVSNKGPIRKSGLLESSGVQTRTIASLSMLPILPLYLYLTLSTHLFLYPHIISCFLLSKNGTQERNSRTFENTEALCPSSPLHTLRVAAGNSEKFSTRNSNWGLHATKIKFTDYTSIRNPYYH